jgi:hypothetical protein
MAPPRCSRVDSHEKDDLRREKRVFIKKENLTRERRFWSERGVFSSQRERGKKRKRWRV